MPPWVILRDFPLARDSRISTLPSANSERRGVSPARVGTGAGAGAGAGCGGAWAEFFHTEALKINLRYVNIHRSAQIRCTVRVGPSLCRGEP